MKIYLKIMSLILATVCVFSCLSLPVFAEEGPGGDPPSGEQPGDPPDGERPGDPPDGEGGGPGGPGGSGGPGGANTMTYDYSGSLSGAVMADGTEVSSSDETITTDTVDENAALAANGGTLTLTDGTLQKSGSDSNGDNCNFYGINSIALAVGEDSQMILCGMTLAADSTGSNAIFATDNATVLAKDVTITTTSDNSRGLDATYGGTILADDVNISTQGDHCAALATDRGGGQISVTNSDLNTAGSGSPLLYSTGDIEVFSVTGTATGSQVAGMEGLNTILIYDSNLTSTNTTTTGSDPVANGIILYQSTSGDAEASTGETATFQAVRSTLSSAIESGAMFYVTNTSVDVLLEDTALNFDNSAAKLLQIEGNDANNWGSAGKNGADVKLTAIREPLTGDISVDTISSLDLYLTDNTTYTGQIEITENAYGSTSEAPVQVHLDSTSTWIVTYDSTISALYAEAGSQIVDTNGQAVTIVSADGSVLAEGASDVTVTVTGTYSTEASGSASAATDSFIDRSAFDEYFGTEEAAEEETPTEEESPEEESAVEESSMEESSETESSIEESSEESSAAESISEENSIEESIVEESSIEESVAEESSAAEPASSNSAKPWIIAGAAIILVAAIALTIYQKKKKKV